MTASRRSWIALSLTSCLLSHGLLAQDQEAKATQPDPQKLLSTSIAKMQGLKNVQFRTSEAQDSAMQRAIAAQMGGMGGMLGGNQEKEVRGRWQEGILKATLNDDADEILTYRGRMLARNDAIGWKIRRGRLANGGALPFVLDPVAFMDALAALPAAARKVKNLTDATYKDKPVKILSMTLEGEAAQDFALCGALPAMSAGMGGGMVMRMAGGGAGAAPMPEPMIDIAVYIEPATGIIHKIKTRTYEESAAAGQFRVQIAGAGIGGGEEEEEEEEVKEEVKETDDQGKRIYKRGLPVRALGESLSRMDFDIVFSKHNNEKGMTIPEAAKKILRIGK